MGMGLASQYLFPSLNEETSLADVVEVDSWWVMNVLNLSCRVSYYLIDKDIEQWEEDNAYIESKKTVCLMNVVNDPAERAVKLTADFVGAARGEEHFQNILQVVEANHKDRAAINFFLSGILSKGQNIFWQNFTRFQHMNCYNKEYYKMK